LEREAVNTLLSMHGVKETEDPRSKWKKRQKNDMWIQVRVLGFRVLGFRSKRGRRATCGFRLGF
jgi:hypothetical protein